MKENVVFISGTNGASGAVITRQFLETGATVIGASRSISSRDFQESNFFPLAADFTNPVAVRQAVESCVTRFGKLDILVHVLGGFAGGRSVAETEDATWEQMRDLNLTAAFYFFRAAIPHLRKSGRGRIIAIGSQTATQAHPGLGGYVTFKAAMQVLVQTVALENKDAGLTANVLLPGTIDTPANRRSMPGGDFSKWIQPGIVADLVLWLADERASHITGAGISIDGSNV